VKRSYRQPYRGAVHIESRGRTRCGRRVTPEWWIATQLGFTEHPCMACLRSDEANGRPDVPSGICRVCGCTDEAACFGGCSWVDRAHTLCSACDPPPPARDQRAAKRAAKMAGGAP
jgi:hypothetical protein